MFSRISKRLLPILLVLSLLVPMAMPAFAASTSGTHTPVTGVTVSVSGATDNFMTDGAITVTAAGSAGIFGFGASAKTATITVYNDSTATSTVSFDWTASSVNQLTIDGTVYTAASGNFSKVMAAGESFTVTIVTGKNSTTNTLVMKNFGIAQASESSVVTFNYDSALGSVTVAGTPVAAGGKAEIAVAGAALVATPVSGATFLGWTNADGSIISKSASYTLVPANDMTVKAVFVNSSSAPYFYANGDTYLIEGLAEAASFASTASTKTIVLANDATLPAGDYTIPAGVTLLIPFDSAHTLYTTAPGANELSTGVFNELPTVEQYRKLNMASGANITVNGAISLSAKHQSGGCVCGAPEGPCSFIEMADGSNITVNNGAYLYAWGYIVGDGNVTAKSGATVYENFQVYDWHGGSVTSEMANDTTYGVFPMSQYYVQNIEVPLTYEAGAVEYGVMSATISVIGVQTISVPFIGTGSSMFNVTSGSMTKFYDGSTDRLMIEVNGDLSVNPVSMSMKLGILGSTTIQTANFELPINNNMTVDVISGNISINQDIAFLPGSVMNIHEGAKATLGSGVSVYLYDRDDWGNYVTANNVKFNPINYAYSKTYTRTEADLVDAEILVNGTIDASQGYAYVTSGGAKIYSTGTGVINYTPGSQTVTYQMTHGDPVVYNEIAITNAKLMNADGSYTDAAIADTYTYTNGVWTGTQCSHNYELTASTAATCTAAGSNTYTCSLCGDSYTESVAALGHTETVDAAVAATCTATGLTEGKHCTVCGTVTVAQTVVAALGHTEVVDAAVAATCTAEGLTEGKHCSVCGTVTVAQETVAALGHTEVVDAAVAATCTAEGLTEGKHCTVCGTVTVAQEVVSALGHSYDAVVTAPTCTEEGYTTYTCSVCGDTYAADEVAAAGHVEGEAVVENTVEATCTEEGSYDSVVYCAVCGVELTRNTVVVEAKGHNYEVTEVVAPTCTVNGYSVYTCSVCGDSYNADPVDAEGHPYVAVVTDPTCTEAGYTTYTCSVCGDTYVADEVAALGHTEVVIEAVAPTCTEAGSTEGKYCAVCGEVLTAPEAVDPAGHSYEVTEVVAPTCTVNGYSVYTCSVCGDSYNADPVDAEGHPYVAVVTDPTCTEAGYTTYTCSVCGDTYVADEVAALGHTEVVIEAVAPTCTEAGSTEGKYCAVCGEVLVAPEAVDPAGHSYEVTEVVAPTCTVNGYSVYTCSVCGDSYNADPVDAEGHPYEAVVTDPTCTEAGYTTYTCGVCGDTYVADEVAALGHTEVVIEAVAPTCTEAGSTEGKYCAVCGEVLTAPEAVAATGHAYGEWYTTVEPTTEAVGEERRDCANCDAYETNELPMIEVDENAPVLTTEGYNIMLTKADTFTYIRYVAGTYNTASDIKNAAGCVTLSASKIAGFTTDGVCTLEMADGGIYSLWVKTSEGKEYIFHADLTEMEQTVTTYGVSITVNNLYGVKDYFIAPGDYDTYADVKANYIFNITSAKINGAHDYTYIVPNAGRYTIYIRYQNTARPATILKTDCVVVEPDFNGNGLQFTISNLDDVKVIRTAYGEYETPGDIKRAEGQRSFSAKDRSLKGKTEFTIQYRYNGTVTVAVVYNHGYEVMYTYEVQQKVPSFVQNGNTVTFGQLDDLNLIRYAEGVYETSNQIKNAGSTVLKTDSIVDGFVTVKLDPGTYTFCVQYLDESYNYYVVTVE